MPRAYLGLGSNMGDKRAMIARALSALAAHPEVTVVARSADYRTPPWGKTDQDWFVNACAVVETGLPPERLLDLCLATERDLGRERRERWGPRAIDIDLLAYDGVTMTTPHLTLPHPQLTARVFVLVPLATIAPDLVIADATVAAWRARVDAAGIEVLGP
jgi:2-amino-4-hydroxy-6-hydroxymethyldihydropteridine diphosphokinase